MCKNVSSGLLTPARRKRRVCSNCEVTNNYENDLYKVELPKAVSYNLLKENLGKEWQEVKCHDIGD